MANACVKAESFSTSSPPFAGSGRVVILRGLWLVLGPRRDSSSWRISCGAAPPCLVHARNRTAGTPARIPRQSDSALVTSDRSSYAAYATSRQGAVMSQVAHPLERSRWSRIAEAWHSLIAAVLGRETAREAESRYDRTISFAEVVWAHFERQKETEANVANGPWEREYRRRLKLFKAEHGEIVESYWCRYEASGVALTENRLPRRLTNFFRHDSILRLHAVTDWRTERAPEIASSIHRWETAGIKATEVLRETSERIALSRIFAAITRLLAFVDREPDAKPLPGTSLAAVVKEQKAQLAHVDDYYQRAGGNAARLVYFRGMLWGAAWFALLVGGSLLLAWWIGWLDPRNEP